LPIRAKGFALTDDALPDLDIRRADCNGPILTEEDPRPVVKITRHDATGDHDAIGERSHAGGSMREEGTPMVPPSQRKERFELLTSRDRHGMRPPSIRGFRRQFHYSMNCDVLRD